MLTAIVFRELAMQLEQCGDCKDAMAKLRRKLEETERHAVQHRSRANAMENRLADALTRASKKNVAGLEAENARLRAALVALQYRAAHLPDIVKRIDAALAPPTEAPREEPAPLSQDECPHMRIDNQSCTDCGFGSGEPPAAREPQPFGHTCSKCSAPGNVHTICDACWKGWAARIVAPREPQAEPASDQREIFDVVDRASMCGALYLMMDDGQVVATPQDVRMMLAALREYGRSLTEPAPEPRPSGDVRRAEEHIAGWLDNWANCTVRGEEVAETLREAAKAIRSGEHGPLPAPQSAASSDSEVDVRAIAVARAIGIAFARPWPEMLSLIVGRHLHEHVVDGLKARIAELEAAPTQAPGALAEAVQELLFAVDASDEMGFCGDGRTVWAAIRHLRTIAEAPANPPAGKEQNDG